MAEKFVAIPLANERFLRRIRQPIGKVDLEVHSQWMLGVSKSKCTPKCLNRCGYSTF